MIFSQKFIFSGLFYSHLLAIWIFFTPSITSASTADGKAMEGMALYQKQKFNQASKKFLEARQGKPNDPKISYNLGNSRYKQGDYAKALQSYSRSVEQNSNSSTNQKANYNMGNALFRMNKLEESIVAYKKALELDPSDMDAKFNLEFVREQIKKKKQNQDEQKKNKNKENTPLEKEKSNPINHQKQNESKNNLPQETEIALEKMTKEEAEQKLSTLTENLKEFQKKQALEMKSLFTYQGNDW
ncbi:MAG TPA: tetratricopeptide repeat protein [Nitrospinaceae bacterium]|nr:tetratricopeptide repeat protein [Nitrospinaceae bacterium]